VEISLEEKEMILEKVSCRYDEGFVYESQVWLE